APRVESHNDNERGCGMGLTNYLTNILRGCGHNVNIARLLLLYHRGVLSWQHKHGKASPTHTTAASHQPAVPTQGWVTDTNIRSSSLFKHSKLLLYKIDGQRHR
ncbi:unnamed protein product, partial [Ectocarpus sp. 6 AP-2014]